MTGMPSAPQPSPALLPRVGAADIVLVVAAAPDPPRTRTRSATATCATGARGPVVDCCGSSPPSSSGASGSGALEPAPDRPAILLVGAPRDGRRRSRGRRQLRTSSTRAVSASTSPFSTGLSRTGHRLEPLGHRLHHRWHRRWPIVAWRWSGPLVWAWRKWTPVLVMVPGRGAPAHHRRRTSPAGLPPSPRRSPLPPFEVSASFPRGTFNATVLAGLAYTCC